MFSGPLRAGLIEACRSPANWTASPTFSGPLRAGLIEAGKRWGGAARKVGVFRPLAGRPH